MRAACAACSTVNPPAFTQTTAACLASLPAVHTGDAQCNELRGKMEKLEQMHSTLMHSLYALNQDSKHSECPPELTCKSACTG